MGIKSLQRNKKKWKSFLENLPQAHHIARKVETQMKAMVAPGSIFEELGLNYIGPIDGHDINELMKVIGNLKDFEGPQFLHVITKKRCWIGSCRSRQNRLSCNWKNKTIGGI